MGKTPSADEPVLGVVGCLKQKGFRVICYEDGSRFWSIQVRCRTLLAGSLWLLDSARQEFEEELGDLVARLLDAEAKRLDEEDKLKEMMEELGLVGESPFMISAFRWILQVSKLSDIPALITGETGTGKELLAQAIHKLDAKRRNGPFLAVNCGAITSTLAESELFGHRRGAFTGADRDRKGLIRAAHGGVLLLDEVGELSEAMQPKLLRVLQENRVLGVGEDQEVPVSVRIIAATNRDLGEMVRQGKFRADLFYRLDVLSIHLPSLRERPADIKPLTEHFVGRHRHLNPGISFSVGPDFIEALTRVPLPGNARELENLVRRAVIQKIEESPLSLEDLPLEIWQQISAPGQVCAGKLNHQGDTAAGSKAITETSQEAIPPSLVDLLEANGWNLLRSLQNCERLFMELALHRARGNQTQTARLLGITPRSVYNKVQKHRLNS